MNFESNFTNNNEGKEKNDRENIVDNKKESGVEGNEFNASVMDQCLDQMKSGEAVAVALKGISPESLENGLKQREAAWEQASRDISKLESFSNLENASDEELEDAYLKYFESQSSDLYLGKILVNLDSLSSRAGFFNVYNDKESEGLPENLSKSIKIVEKLVGASKRVKTKKEKTV